VLTAYKISGYPSSSGKKKAVEVLINIRILKFIQISVYGTYWKVSIGEKYLLRILFCGILLNAPLLFLIASHGGSE